MLLERLFLPNVQDVVIADGARVKYFCLYYKKDSYNYCSITFAVLVAPTSSIIFFISVITLFTHVVGFGSQFVVIIYI